MPAPLAGQRAPLTVAVLGGTGFVGRALAQRLARAGVRTLVPTRRLAHGQALQSLPTVELLQADVHDDGALARVLARADAVVNLVAILHGSPAAFEQAHVALPRRLAQVLGARGAPAPLLVHVSALGVGPQAPSHYLRSKTAGEALLAASRLPLAVLRPSVIFGAEDRFLNLFARLQRLAPAMPLAGGHARFQPVWVEDVAAGIAALLADPPAAAGRVVEAVGPRVYTLAELVRLAGRWSGHERPQLPLPMALGRVQAALLEALPGTPLMSRDNLDSMRVPNVASGTLPTLAALGIEATALEAVAPAYLSGQVARTRLDRWRREAGRR